MHIHISTHITEKFSVFNNYLIADTNCTTATKNRKEIPDHFIVQNKQSCTKDFLC